MLLVIATRNLHKVEEIRAMLPADVTVLTLRDFPDAPPVIEDAQTFAGNAALKSAGLAAWLSRHPGLLLSRMEQQDGCVYVLADDSGLEVDALNGAPGIYSARFAAMDSGAPGNSSDAENNAKLLRLLANVPLEKRTARFRCAIALTSFAPGAESIQTDTKTFEGACEGRIQLEPSGGSGFGYDPLFVPEGFRESFADLGEGTKNQISHRACALEGLKCYLQGIAHGR